MQRKAARLLVILAEGYAAAVFLVMLGFLPFRPTLTQEWVTWIVLLTLTLTSVWTANAVRKGRLAGRRVAIVLGVYGATMLAWRGRQMGEAFAGHASTPVLVSWLIAGSGWLALIVAMGACLLTDVSRPQQAPVKD
jgi:hypothetical protein